MTTFDWILLDYLVACLSAATWVIAGVAARRRQPRLALSLVVAGTMLVVARTITVTALARAGWWFAEEKVTVVLPLVATTALATLLLAGPPLARAARGGDDDLPSSTVALPLSACCASMAGLALTSMAGYPLRWSTALITFAGLGAAVLVIVRSLTGGPDSENPADRRDRAPDGAAGTGLSRRRFVFVAGGLAVVTAGAGGVGLSFLPAPKIDTGGGPGGRARTSVSVADLRGPNSPAPGGARIQRTLTARTAGVELETGEHLHAWTYDGTLPGSAIRATQGDLLEVTLRNTDIVDGVTIHWHGYDVPCGEDGVPDLTQTAVLPGGEFIYRFRTDQVGTYWYHTHEASAEGVRRGLYGTLVVDPRENSPGGSDPTLDLTLPVHTFEEVLALGDRSGRADYEVETGRPVRLRLVNTDSSPHRFALSGTPFRVAAADGRDLNEPDVVRDLAVRLPAGGRRDLIFDMPDAHVNLVLDGSSVTTAALRPVGSDPAPKNAQDTGGWSELDLLSYGKRDAVPFDTTHADRHFTLVLGRGIATVDGRPALAQTVNGRGHPSIPDQLVTEGDIVRFTVVNRSLETHPWHLHGHPVLVLSRNGTPSTGSPVWLDTFEVRPGDIWEVAFRATNPGVWMNHCHNLPHADQGMMLRLIYDGVTPIATMGAHHHAH